MPETTGQRVQLPSDGKQRTEAKAKTEKTGDCRRWLANGKCFKGESCGFKHDMNKKGEGKGKRDRPSSPWPGPRSQNKDSKDGTGAAKGKVPKGTSPSGKPNQPSCFSYLKENSVRSRKRLLASARMCQTQDE